MDKSNENICEFQTPQAGFLDFSPIFQISVFHICIYLGYWGVEEAMCNILELHDKNPWRNNESNLTTFDLILQRPHSAMTLQHFDIIRTKAGKGTS